ncbi:class I SAM-dependent methyltransferase [Chitinophaga agrisoli]|uniref:Class I SAM-dependent methyltransferase n=1 Tax=Chitinophaga agrisoli TaxID=2607653 RepID=A0A5B2VUS4_9BACT|nr:class I SAM-dependent methyltransferase [Chitinophaga agrisoli]KAA2242825.1 class I SAM-dependent methyltransferase [Chitinophaga agrisoli]
MHPILEEIDKTGKYINSRKQTVTIGGETPIPQCEFLQKIIRENKFKSAVEVGMAYGISSLAIAEALAENAGRLTSMDPFETGNYDNNGLDLVKQGGYEIEFFEDFSHTVLPRLAAEGRRLDFAYIDSTKMIDWLMTDFFLIDRMMDVGGVVVFDDITYPSIRKLVRYLAQMPHYEVYGQFPYNKRASARRKILKNWLTFGLKDGVTMKDYRLGIYGRCIALKKVGEDKRLYDWHVRF